MTNQSKDAGFLNTLEGCYNRLQGGCILTIVNVAFVLLFGWLYYTFSGNQALAQNGESATGVVVALEESGDPEGGCCVYTPLVEFSVSGQRYTFEGGVASDPPAYEVGEQVAVLYDPNDPETADIESLVASAPVWLVVGMALVVLVAIVINFFFIRSIWRGEPIDPEG